VDQYAAQIDGILIGLLDIVDECSRYITQSFNCFDWHRYPCYSLGLIRRDQLSMPMMLGTSYRSTQHTVDWTDEYFRIKWATTAHILSVMYSMLALNEPVDLISDVGRMSSHGLQLFYVAMKYIALVLELGTGESYGELVHIRMYGVDARDIVIEGLRGALHRSGGLVE
jgi:hypothetical protein